MRYSFLRRLPVSSGRVDIHSLSGAISPSRLPPQRKKRRVYNQFSETKRKTNVWRANERLIRTVTVFTLFSILLLTLALYSSPAMAEEEEATPIDMDTDDDGNGIPNEFETEFRVLLDSMLSMDAGLLNMRDIYQGDAYKALRGFYERLPIQAKTKQVLDAIPGLYQKLILDDALEKNPDALDELVAKETEAIEDDEVYATAVEYIEAITSDVAGADPGTSAKSGDTPPVSGQNQQSYEDLINQVGDILYRDTGPTGASKIASTSNTPCGGRTPECTPITASPTMRMPTTAEAAPVTGVVWP